MIKRIAILVGGTAAAAVLAVGLAAAGFGPVATNADQPDAEAIAAADPAALPPTEPLVAEPIVQVETETVYIRPAATPRTIRITKTVQADRSQASGSKEQAKKRSDDDEDDSRAGRDRDRDDDDRDDGGDTHDTRDSGGEDD